VQQRKEISTHQTNNKKSTVSKNTTMEGVAKEREREYTYCLA